MDELVLEINKFLKSKDWFDFELDRYENGNLTILGSTDFSYYHEIEIVFEDVAFIQCPKVWSVNTIQDVIIKSYEEEQRRINIDYEIEQGNILFKIVAEDKAPIFISSRSISHKIEKVNYNVD